VYFHVFAHTTPANRKLALVLPAGYTLASAHKYTGQALAFTEQAGGAWLYDGQFGRRGEDVHVIARVTPE
ncbi:MAG: hypothetical protein OXE40_01470, partial [Gammaproteobacteria bacterium]|nr:hypothetical protein [Gammaproteobacteria bacterium]